MITKSSRTTEAERVEMINECRRSGLSDAEWCRQNGINRGTFVMWVYRCKESCAAEKLIKPAAKSSPTHVIRNMVHVSIIPNDNCIDDAAT